MQMRPYPGKDGQRVWLSRSEQAALLDVYDGDEDPRPRRRIALQLGLHGLRADEVAEVCPEHFRRLDGAANRHALVIPDGKTGRREVPVAEDLYQRVRHLKTGARMRQDDTVVDVGKRQVRNWVEEARDRLADDRDDGYPWHELGMHDLRRTWATDSFYSLAFNGVPIAETLTMSWGGWRQTETGRETFRQNYLGPVPDHIVVQAAEFLPGIEEDQ